MDVNLVERPCFCHLAMSHQSARPITSLRRLFSKALSNVPEFTNRLSWRTSRITPFCRRVSTSLAHKSMPRAFSSPVRYILGIRFFDRKPLRNSRYVPDQTHSGPCKAEIAQGGGDLVQLKLLASFMHDTTLAFVVLVLEFLSSEMFIYSSVSSMING